MVISPPCIREFLNYPTTHFSSLDQEAQENHLASATAAKRVLEIAVKQMNKHNDRQWMRQALTLAKKGWGRTSPNPMVGALIVKQDRVIGRGWHRQAGLPHAEIEALQSAVDNPRDATLYVTLEPCCSHGRTPPCVNAIVNAGINRVVIGTLDPNPQHNGRGVELLRAHGIEVITDIESRRCRQLNEAFFCWIRHHRPYVMLKMAMTIDGKIATASGVSQWISGTVSRRRVQKMRQWADAVLVGGETIRQDNPELIVRTPRDWPRQPMRLIASKSRQFGVSPKVFTDGKAPTRIIAARNTEAWHEIFSQLGRENITAVLVEGGGALAGALAQAGVIDKVVLFIAPRILGGTEHRPVFSGLHLNSLNATLPLNDVTINRSGEDFMLTGYLSDVHRLH